MKKVVHRPDTRGRSLYDRLDNHHSSSFDEYYNSECIHSDALRVLNDDRVILGEGFQTHLHKNMEIVPILLKGFLVHGDNRKDSRTITVGNIQVMGAGTGIYHNGMNDSKSEPVEFLQIWIMPRERNTHPLYQGYDIRGLLKKNELALILSPDGSTPAKLLQDTWFSMGKAEAGKTLEYKTYRTNMGVYVFLIEGEIKTDDIILTRRDELGTSETKSFGVETLKDSKILLIEVPM